MAHTSYNAPAVNDAGEMMKVFIIDSEDDIENLPTNVMPGSMARTADCSVLFSLDNSGSWVRIGNVSAG